MLLSGLLVERALRVEAQYLPAREAYAVVVRAGGGR